MKYEVQKISKITEEMLNFFFINYTDKINISIENADDAYIIVFQSDNVKCSEKRIMEINKLLNVQRQHEIEEYYWQLVGNDPGDEEYNLIGMMVDEAKVEFESPHLKIKLSRYK